MKLKIIFFVIFSVLVIEIVGAFSIYYLFDDWGDRGTFGDMFGGINSLFSGLAFCGVVIAILIQQDELSLQRKELELTRKEFSRGSEAHEAAVKAAKVQADTVSLSAQLTAINHLLEIKNDKKRALNSVSMNQQQRKIYETLNKEIRILESRLSFIYKKIVEQNSI